MRIRKNIAKASAFINAFLSQIPDSTPNSNTHPQPTLCLLNQSPWDILTFPSSFDDFINSYHVNLPAAGSSRAIHSVDSTKNSFDCEYNYDIVNGNQNGNVDEEIKDYELYENGEDEELGFIKGCVKKGDNVVVDLQNDAVWSTNKKAQSTSTKSSGTKKKRAVVGIILKKKNEFYYYSGFGPSWGRKRRGSNCTNFNAYGTTTTSSGGVSDTDLEEDEKRVEPDTTMADAVWSCQVTPESEDFDHVEEDVQDCTKQKEKAIKKRGRKPIKARSLKSLM